MTDTHTNVETEAQRGRSLTKGHTAGRIQTRLELTDGGQGCKAIAPTVASQLPQILFLGIWALMVGTQSSGPISCVIPIQHHWFCWAVRCSHIPDDKVVQGRHLSCWRNTKVSSVAAVVGQEVRGRNKEGDRVMSQGQEQVLQGLCHGKDIGLPVVELARLRGAHLASG
jgi:hypothetical protein